MVTSSIVEKAFAERPDLKKRTYDAIGTMVIPLLPNARSFLGRAGRLMLRSAIPTTHNPARGHSYLHTNATNVANHLIYQRRPSTLQKRKLEDNSSDINGASHPSPSEWKPGYYTVPDMSFLVAQRKTHPRSKPVTDEGLRAKNPTTGTVEFGIEWRDVQHAVCLPMPEKVQRQYTFASSLPTVTALR
jgi:hypothetical protein